MSDHTLLLHKPADYSAAINAQTKVRPGCRCRLHRLFVCHHVFLAHVFGIKATRGTQTDAGQEEGPPSSDIQEELIDV